MYRTIKDIIAANKAAGHHWFSKETMEFFESKVETEIYPFEGGAYFITSEQFHGSYGYKAPRSYTARMIDNSGVVSTVGSFEAHESKQEAMDAIADLL